MKLTQQSMTDIGILVLGVITAVIIIRSHRLPSSPSLPSLPSETQQLIGQATDPIVLFKAGKDFSQKGDLLAAAASFKKTTQLDNQWRDAFLYLGQTYLALDEAKMPIVPGDLTWLSRAEFALKRAARLDPLYRPSYEQLLVVYERTGQVQKATEIRSKIKSLPST